MYIKEVRQQHLKTLLKLNKLTKGNVYPNEKTLNIFLTDTFAALYLHGHPPYGKSSNIALSPTKLTLILCVYGNGTSPNVFIEYLCAFILHRPPKIRKSTHQLRWIITNINTQQHSTISTYITGPSYSLLVSKKLKSVITHQTSTKHN